MTLALFIFAIALAIGIARYNNSNKLFWTLLTCFILGIACTKIVHDTFSEKEQSEQSLDQAYPTQGLAVTGNTFMLFTNPDNCLTDVKVTSKPVSQAIIPVSSNGFITANVTNSSRDQPVINVLTYPPELYDTS
jgi:hypothetical protein